MAETLAVVPKDTSMPRNLRTAFLTQPASPSIYISIPSRLGVWSFDLKPATFTLHPDSSWKCGAYTPRAYDRDEADSWMDMISLGRESKSEAVMCLASHHLKKVREAVVDWDGGLSSCLELHELYWETCLKRSVVEGAHCPGPSMC